MMRVSVCVCVCMYEVSERGGDVRDWLQRMCGYIVIMRVWPNGRVGLPTSVKYGLFAQPIHKPEARHMTEKADIPACACTRPLLHMLCTHKTFICITDALHCTHHMKAVEYLSQWRPAAWIRTK